MSEKKLRVYLAGPMRQIAYFNFPAFDKAAGELRRAGHIVFNPAERDRKIHGEKVANRTGNIKLAEKRGFSLRKALGDDTRWLCKHAECIALLPGWGSSSGAKAEKALALALGLKVMYLKNGKGKK